MFTWLVRDAFGGAEVSCVKLPATVAFPTDDRLLQRLEASRRALPPNSVKALRTKRAAEGPAAQPTLDTEDHDEALPEWGSRVAAAQIQKFPAQWTLPPTVHIEDVYARSRIAVGRR